MSPADDDAAEAQHDGIIDAIPALIWFARSDGSTAFVNRRWLEYTGLSQEQAIGWGWTTAVHPDDRDRVGEYWSACLAAGVAGEIEARLCRLGDQYRWFLFRAEPVRDQAGAVIGWYGLNLDIDDRRRLKDALGASEQDLRSILDSVPAFVSVLDAAGALEWVSKPLLDYFGLNLADLQHWKMNGAVHPDDVPRSVAEIGARLPLGLPIELEHRLRRADGEYRWFLLRSLPMRDSTGRIVRWFAVVTDIHDLKLAEEALREAQAKLSRAAHVATVAEFAASIAHEVNQPLAALVTNAQACLRWLSAEPANLEKAREAAERIVRYGGDAGAVVSRVRSLFKRADIEKAAFDLNVVIREVRCMLKREAVGRGGYVEIDLDEGLPRVLGDRVQMQQVLFNLVVNALESLDGVADRPRQIVVRSLRHDATTAIVTVRDNGVGLQDAGKIFEPFFTTKRNGMGMGLAICQSIVTAHDGKLWAAGNDGPGATFSFTLPLLPERSP